MASDRDEDSETMRDAGLEKVDRGQEEEKTSGNKSLIEPDGAGGVAGLAI